MTKLGEKSRIVNYIHYKIKTKSLQPREKQTGREYLETVAVLVFRAVGLWAIFFSYISFFLINMHYFYNEKTKPNPH